jgi:hypothetical protein
MPHERYKFSLIDKRGRATLFVDIGPHLEYQYKWFQDTLNEYSSTESIAFDGNVHVGDYNIPNFVKNVYFTIPNREFFYNQGLYNFNVLENKSQNFYIYVSGPTPDKLKYLEGYCPSNVKFIPGKLSLLGCLHGRYIDKSVSNLDSNKLFISKALEKDFLKYKKLKNFNKILFMGSPHMHRLNDIKQIESHTGCSIEVLNNFDLFEKTILDFLIEKESFCLLSLDGTLSNCYRDNETGFAKIFNLKYTHIDSNISTKNGIYMCNTLEGCDEQIKKIKKDIQEENYDQLERANIHIHALWNIRQTWVHELLSLIEVTCYACGKDVDEFLIDHSSLFEPKSNCALQKKEILESLDKFLNNSL